MNMKEKMPLVMGLAAAFALLTGFQGGCHPRSQHPDPAHMAQLVTQHLDDVLDDIGATDAQRTQVQALTKKVLQDSQPFLASHRETEQKLLAEWESAQPNPAQIHAVIDARIDALRALAHETADTAIQIHAILTPEQRAQVSKKLLHRRME